MTIKTKITVSLICISICLVSIYVYTATKIFKDDKLSYVFEDQNTRLQTYIIDFNQKAEEAIWFSRFVLKDYGKENAGEELKGIFEDQKSVLGIYVYNLGTKKLEALAHKDTDYSQDIQLYIDRINLKKIETFHLKDNAYLNSDPLSGDEAKTHYMVFNYSPDETMTGVHQVVFFDSNQMLKNMGHKYLNDAQITALKNNSELNKDGLGNSTTRMDIGSTPFLVTMAKTRFDNLRFLSAANENEVLRALSELTLKSIVYLLITIFVTFIVAVLLSNRITYRIHQLTLTATEIGKGNFDVAPDFDSKDEMGVLARAFGKMGAEIKMLFASKMEKDRMERELKNARLIQDRLFPDRKNFREKDFHLSGFYTTSTECGGDWWHYYQYGMDLYLIIADATGHGTPAALITAASKAIFSHIETQSYDIQQISNIWDETVYQSGKGEIWMTAQICRINMVTGDAEIVNLGHEFPVIFRKEKNASSYIVLDANNCLGEHQIGEKFTHTFTMNPGDKLFMYTDGIPTMMSDGNDQVSEKHFLKAVNRCLINPELGYDDSAERVYNELLAVSSQRPLDDDVTMIVIQRS